MFSSGSLCSRLNRLLMLASSFLERKKVGKFFVFEWWLFEIGRGGIFASFVGSANGLSAEKRRRPSEQQLCQISKGKWMLPFTLNFVSTLTFLRGKTLQTLKEDTSLSTAMYILCAIFFFKSNVYGVRLFLAMYTQGCMQTHTYTHAQMHACVLSHTGASYRKAYPWWCHQPANSIQKDETGWKLHIRFEIKSKVQSSKECTDKRVFSMRLCGLQLSDWTTDRQSLLPRLCLVR